MLSIQKMKVLHLGKLCPPNEGGIELFTFDLLENLNKKGVKADLLCFGEDTKIDMYKGFRYFSCKMILKLNSAPLSYDYFRVFRSIEKNYDIIHIHTPNPLAEFLGLISEKPIIVHWHSDIVRQKISYKFYKPFQQKLLKKSQKIIATSPQYLQTSLQLQNHKEKAVVIPSGLNPSRLENKVSDEKFEKIRSKIQDKKIVLSVGRLVEYKGFSYLIEAAKFLGDDVLVLIIGGGPLYNSLKNKIEELGLERKVFLLGRVENISPFLKICNLFCLPSIERNEAFGLSLVEAMYFGKPLITTDVKGSGMSYVNRHNETGLVVPPKNPEALAEAINKILYDKDLYNRFSENAKSRFKEFDINSIADKIINLYQEVLKC